ncbi:nudC domain-containing protein 1 [Drosophila mojavensis]|uniref:NudC domain-containing protein 1 n=1 Tax=Drosophila mojavensis TaxID=7230 RepID=B4L244_DROMO|nr:nudC domain-containing protein 1 [Drosophila mojavensis]EDW06784.1 uncharacterized protein Dmoj_GI15211 [Drosophila mojavensis]
MVTVVDLKVDRNLLCPNFDGYKLSFDSVPMLRQSFRHYKALKYDLYKNHYSLLHTELFAKHNLLTADPWARRNTYFVNTNHEVVHCSFDEIRSDARKPRIVYKMQFEDSGDGYYQPGDYNYSMRFISEKYCVLCDGRQSYFLLETGDRRRHTEWRLVTKTHIIPSSETRGFVLYDARLDILHARKQVSLVAGHVTRSKSTDRHLMLLNWSYWMLPNIKEEVWFYVQREQLQTVGSVYYCAFEPHSESIIVCTDGQLKTAEEARVETLQELNKFSCPQYKWTQTERDIVVKFDVPTGTNLHNYNFKYSSTHINFKLYEQTLLEGTLYARVNGDFTIINLDENGLTLKMIKEEAFLWPQLMQCEDEEEEEKLFDEEIGDVAEVEEEAESSEAEPEPLPIPNLEEPIEECDLAMATDEPEIQMVRYNLHDSKITHKVSLGNMPPLFTTSLRAGYPPAFATREGVDASLWLQSHQPVNPSGWKVRHEGNLHAFGYVLASKQQRKFIDCCPDLEYAVIAETRRHVFIYKPRNESAGGLRNRNGAQVIIGKQHLVTLNDDFGDILGMATAPNLITLLTAKAVLFLSV